LYATNQANPQFVPVSDGFNPFTQLIYAFLLFSSDESKEILERCTQLLCPSLKDAEIVEDWIGLRPFREGGVRLELEDVEIQGNQKIKVTKKQNLIYFLQSLIGLLIQRLSIK
jgi:hypothetical protein